MRAPAIDAVVFDLDGVLLDSEQVWDRVRREYVLEMGGSWRDDSQRRMMGMSTEEWSRYVSADLGVGRPPGEVAAAVVDRVARAYGDHPPLIEGAVAAVRGLGRLYPLGLASSSARTLIDLALRSAGLAGEFSAVVSTEECARGKPAPDVYLAAAGRLGVTPARCAAVEDSSNGLRSAAAAAMKVIAIPNRHYPPEADALALAAVVLPDIASLTPAVVAGLGA